MDTRLELLKKSFSKQLSCSILLPKTFHFKSIYGCGSIPIPVNYNGRGWSHPTEHCGTCSIYWL